MSTPQRILLVGDLDADVTAARTVVSLAGQVGADLILQLGDFGYRTDGRDDHLYLRELHRALIDQDLELWFVDGERDDHPALHDLQKSEDGRQRVTDRIWYLPRGHRWTWNGTDWVALGGGVSLDRAWRYGPGNHTPEERMRNREADRIIAGGLADVVVSHDGPLAPRLRVRLGQTSPIPERPGPYRNWPDPEAVRLSDEHQRRVHRVLEGVQRPLVSEWEPVSLRAFHSHHHIRYRETFATGRGDIQVTGLTGVAGRPPSSWSVLVDTSGHLVRDVLGEDD